MLGHRTIGGAAIGGLPGPALILRTPAIISVGGVELATWSKCNISDTLGGRSTATIGFVDFQKNIHPTPGSEVRIKWQDQLLFAGTIDFVDESITERNDSGDVIFGEIRCLNWNNLLDRFYDYAAYVEKSLEYILNDILQVQTKLFEDGVRLGSVADATIDKAVFGYVNVNAAFRELAERTGLAWNIDYFKRLHFFDRSTFNAPLLVGDNVAAPTGGFFSKLYWTPWYFTSNYWPAGGESDVQINVYQKTRGMRYSKSREQYRNKQWIRAGFDITDVQIERFHGDPESIEEEKRNRKFQLVYQVNDIISITRDDGAGPVTQRLGIRSVDKDGDTKVPSPTTWPQWFYAKGEKEINQNSKEDDPDPAEPIPDSEKNPAMTAEDTLVVTYHGRFPMIVEEENLDEIAARQGVEGGSGVYEHLEEDSQLDGRDLGTEKAVRLLSLYGRIPAELEVELDLPYLVPGHLLDITVQNFGLLAAEFLVDRMSIDFVDRTIPRCRLTMLDGERQGGWADFFRKLASSGRKTVIRENEVVAKRTRLTDQLNFADVINDSENGNAQLEDFRKDPYSWAMIGNAVVLSSGEEVPSCLVGRSIIGSPDGS